MSVKDQGTWAIQGRGFWQYVCDSFNGDFYFHTGVSGDQTSMWNDVITNLKANTKLETMVFASAQIESCFIDHSQYDVAFVQTKYNDTKDCDRRRVGEKCMRGMCLLNGNYNILTNIPDAAKV
jgi:hypothetical protein